MVFLPLGCSNIKHTLNRRDSEMLLSVSKFIHLLLIVVLIRGSLSNAYYSKGIENLSNAYYSKGLSVAAGGCNAASNGKPDDSLSQNDSRKLKLRGRKIAFDGFLRLDKTREIGLCEETWTASSRARSKEKKKASLNVVKGQQSMRSILSKKKKLAEFGAFTADYRGPTHHPPRNN